MKTCEHQHSECDCQKCDSFTCFEKRRKRASCKCAECKNSETCVLFPDKNEQTKCDAKTKVNRGCNTKEVWQKTDKFHLGRDVVCSNCEPNKSRRSGKDTCTHGTVYELCDDDSMKSDDKLCSQCEFKRNVLGCLHDGNVIVDQSADSSQDQVLCSKCELKRSNLPSKNDCSDGHVCKKLYSKFDDAATGGHVCRKGTIHDADNSSGHVCKKFDSKDTNTNTTCMKKTDSVKDKTCTKCCTTDAAMQKFKKHSFDDGKVYEFQEDAKDSHVHGKICGKCQLKKNVLERFKKFSFDNGKIYDFDPMQSNDKAPTEKKCNKCQLKKESKEKSTHLCDLHKSEDNEMNKDKQPCHHHHISENCSKCLSMKAAEIEGKQACGKTKDTECRKKDSKPTKVCTKCGRNRLSEPISMKIIYTDKNGNDIVCNKIIKTITKTEKDKVYKFKDSSGTKIEKKISSKEFKKSFERQFGKATQVNSLTCPQHKGNKATRRHLSAQVMNVPSAKALPITPCKCASATQANKKQPPIPRFDIFKRIKQIYDACSCKDCQCVTSNDLSSCNAHSIKGKSESKYEQNLQFWEGFRAALNNLLHEKPTCSCKTCECVVCSDGAKAKSCSCKHCQCIECAATMSNKPKQNTIVVAAVGETAPASNCACAPCDCIRCKTNAMSVSSNATHEISTGRARHQNCRCQNCVNDDCVPDDSDLCKCKKQGEPIRKPATTDDKNYDVRVLQVEYDRHNSKRRNDAIAMFVKVPKAYPFKNTSLMPSLYRGSKCSCKSKSLSSFEEVEYIEMDGSSDSSCSCISCQCEACIESREVDSNTIIDNLKNYRCDCDICECNACAGLNENSEGFCPLKFQKLVINDNVSCDCYFCDKMLRNCDPSHDDCLNTKTNSSKNQLLRNKSTNCNMLVNSSSMISLYIPATRPNQENEPSFQSNPSYTISTNNNSLKTCETSNTETPSCRHSFYKEIYEAALDTKCRKDNCALETYAEGHCLPVPIAKGASIITITQSKEQNKLNNTISNANVTLKSIVNKIKSFTNAEKLLNMAKGFSADLLNMLQKYEDANRELTEKSQNYVTLKFSEKKDQLISKVNNQYKLSSRQSTVLKEIAAQEREVWVVDGYCSSNGNVVYIPMKCNDDKNEIVKPIKETEFNKEATAVNYVSTQNAVHINLRLKETAKRKAEKKEEKKDMIKKVRADLVKSSPILQSEVIKPKTTKMDLELRDGNNTAVYKSVESDSFKSYKYSKGDSNTKSLEQTISFNKDYKVSAIEVERVSTCSVIIKWSSPKIDKNVLGYELLIDGRPAQKILSPTRCMALVSSLPDAEKVLLTVKTIMVTASPIKYYPTMNTVYYPVLTKCQNYL